MRGIRCDSGDSVSVERLDDERHGRRVRVTIHLAGEPEGYEAWHDGAAFSEARDEAIARCRGWIRALQALRARDA